MGFGHGAEVVGVGVVVGVTVLVGVLVGVTVGVGVGPKPKHSQTSQLSESITLTQYDGELL